MSKSATLTVKRVKLADLKPHVRNPRHHPEPGSKEWDALKKSLEADYFDPLIVNSGKTHAELSNVLVSGHLRCKVMLADGYTHADAVIKDYDEARHVQVMLRANNQTGAWDEKILADILNGIGKDDLDLTGFDAGEIDGMLKALEGDEPEGIINGESALPGALALKTDMAFPSKEIFGIPTFRTDMLASCPEPITTWAGPDATEVSENYFYNVSTDSVRGLDFAKTVVGFYTDDARFEQSWQQPDVFTGKILNKKPIAVLSPNFSLWLEFPPAVKIWNTYRSRWVGRYFQEAGIRIIPDVNWADDLSFEYCFAGIPKNAPCVSIQLQTGKDHAKELPLKRAGVAAAIDRLKPDSLLIYAGDNYERIIDGLIPQGLKLIVLKNRVQKRRVRMEVSKMKKEQKTTTGGGGAGGGGGGGRGLGGGGGGRNKSSKGRQAQFGKRK